LKNPAMGLELCASLEGQNKMFMTKAHQLGKIAIACNGRGMSDKHEAILP
jgi:hypothetical protein